MVEWQKHVEKFVVNKQQYIIIDILYLPYCSGIPRGGFGVLKPPPEILKALQNRAKLNPIVKTVKNCWI